MSSDERRSADVCARKIAMTGVHPHRDGRCIGSAAHGGWADDGLG